MKLLPFEALSKLSTRRLLAYRDSLLTVPENTYHVMYDKTTRMCKDSPGWKQTYEDCKAILATREHVK